MKTHIRKLLYLLMIPWFMVSLSAQSVFDTNRANVWVIDGENSQSFSVGNWSNGADLKEDGTLNIITEDEVERSIYGVGKSSMVLVNNIAFSAPSLSTSMPSLSLIGLDTPTNSGNDMSKPLLSISPNGGEFNETVKIVLQLNAPSNESYTVTYKINNEKRDGDTVLVGVEGKNQLTFYLSKNGEHSVSYEIRGVENSKKTVNFKIGGNSPKKDSDGDGIPDSVEIALGMNPLDAVIPDSDNDGWNDFNEFLRGTNSSLDNSKPKDSDGDGWSDFDEKLRGTDPHNSEGCIDKPTARSLYGVEYNVKALAYLGYDETTTQIPVLKRVSLVSIDSQNLFDTQIIQNLPKIFEIDGTDYNRTLCHVSKSDLNTSLLAGNILTMRVPADIPLITRVQEKNSENNNTHVVKVWTEARVAVTLQEYLNSTEFDTLAQTEFDAESFRVSYVAYLQLHLVVSKNVTVHQKSSLDVALVEQAFKSREEPVEVDVKAEVLAIIEDGSSGQGYAMGDMPSMITILEGKGANIDEIVTWVANGAQGGDIPSSFTLCASCHGADGKGQNGLAPNLSLYVDKVKSIQNISPLLGNPNIKISSKTYAHTLKALSEEANRTTDNLYKDVINLNLFQGEDVISVLSTYFTIETETLEYKLTTEEILAKAIRDENEDTKYKFSLMTILSKATADTNVSVWNMDDDSDGDGLLNKEEVFPVYYTHPLKADGDGDGIDDKKDLCPHDANNQCINSSVADDDSDDDGVSDAADNCPFVINFDQDDIDGDGIGDACAKLGIVMMTPRTNIQLFKGKIFNFAAKKTIPTTSSTIWLIDDVEVATDTLNYTHTFETLGSKTICVALIENKNNSSCVDVTVLEREVDDSISIYARDISEGDSGSKNLLVEVVLNEALPVQMKYNYETEAKTATKNVDYTHISGELVFEAGEVRKYLRIPIIGDIIGEDDETFLLKVGEDTNRSITIVDDDVIPVNIVDNEVPNPMVTVTKLDSNGQELSDWNVNEADVDKNVTIRLQLNTTVVKNNTSLHYELYQEATVPTPIYPNYHSMIRPFVAGDIEFDIGEQVKDINVTIIGDTVNESNKAFKIMLSNPSNLSLYDMNDNIISEGELANEKAVSFNIVDNDPLPTLSFEKTTETTAEGEQVHVKLLLSTKSYQTVEVNLTAHDDSTAEDSEDMDVDDYNLSTEHVVILATSPSASSDNLEAIVDINISQGLDDEDDETIILDMHSPKNAIINTDANRTTITIEEEAVITPLSSNIFFNYKDTTHGNELWKSNGEIGSASLLKDIIVGESDSFPQNFTHVGNDKLYFLASDANYNKILYRTDGTDGNTEVIRSFGKNQVGNLVDVNGVLYLIYSIVDDNTGQTDVKLWSSDGTDKTLKTVDYLEAKVQMVLSGRFLGIFIGDFWKFNLDTQSLDKITEVPVDALLDNLINCGGVLYFTVNSNEIWWSDHNTTAKSTILDGQNVSVNAMVDKNNGFYYTTTSSADNTVHGLYSYANGESTYSGPTNRAIYTLKAIGSNIYWSMEGSVYAYNGTSIITLKEFENENNIYFLEDSINSELFFTRTVYGASATTTLWKSDGTVGGTVNLTP